MEAKGAERGLTRKWWDFAQEVVGTTVTCSAATLDGHEAQRLLDADKQHKEFICTNFTRPPVELHFTFPHEIEIHSIVINPRVRSHCAEVRNINFYN